MRDRPDGTAAIRRYLELDTGIPGPERIAEDAIWLAALAVRKA